MPDSFALPPVEYCFGTRPIHAANSRPLWNAAPLPIEATIAVAIKAPMPGICLSRRHAASLEAINSTSWFRSTTLLLKILPLVLEQSEQVTHPRSEIFFGVLKDLR